MDFSVLKITSPFPPNCFLKVGSERPSINLDLAKSPTKAIYSPHGSVMGHTDVVKHGSTLLGIKLASGPLSSAAPQSKLAVQQPGPTDSLGSERGGGHGVDFDDDDDDNGGGEGEDGSAQEGLHGETGGEADFEWDDDDVPPMLPKKTASSMAPALTKIAIDKETKGQGDRKEENDWDFSDGEYEPGRLALPDTAPASSIPLPVGTSIMNPSANKSGAANALLVSSSTDSAAAVPQSSSPVAVKGSAPAAVEDDGV